MSGVAAAVVDGEASESDTEIEIADVAQTEAAQAFVVSGEAPESDEESIVKLGTAEAVGDPAVDSVTVGSQRRQRDKSLLHQKLYESNLRVTATADALLRQACQPARARLAAADKMLLSAQESLRSSNNELTTARARLRQVQLALERANCGAALSTVKTR